MMWVSDVDVAKAGVDGMVHNRAVVIPGTANRVMSKFAWFTPRSLLVPILARQHPSLRK